MYLTFNFCKQNNFSGCFNCVHGRDSVSPANVSAKTINTLWWMYNYFNVLIDHLVISLCGIISWSCSLFFSSYTHSHTPYPKQCACEGGRGLCPSCSCVLLLVYVRFHLGCPCQIPRTSQLTGSATLTGLNQLFSTWLLPSPNLPQSLVTVSTVSSWSYY